jgi:hypothetical protein
LESLYLRGGRGPPDCDLTLLPVGGGLFRDGAADDERFICEMDKRQKAKAKRFILRHEPKLKPNGNG